MRCQEIRTAGVVLAAVVAALCCVAIVPAHFAAAQCSTVPALAFKPSGEMGTPSYITPSTTTVYYQPLVEMPPIIVRTVVATSVQTLDFSLQDMLVTCTAVPSLRLGGSSVQVDRGEALFDALTVQETVSSGTSYKLVFSVSDSAGNTYTLDSPPIVAIAAATAPYSVRFRNYGFFNREDASKTVPTNVSLPPFWIEVLGQSGHAISAAGMRLTVSISPNEGRVTPTTFTGSDVFELTTLAYIPPAAYSSTFAGVTFTFTVTSTTPAWTGSVSTGVLTPEDTVVRNRFMLFDRVTSSIAFDNRGDTAVLDIVLPPIVIRLYTSELEEDVSNTGLVILASSDQATLRGAEALVVRGVATFSDLAFTSFAPTSAVITFTAGDQGSLAVAGSKLYSGAMSVTLSPIKASHLAFSPTSKINGLTAVTVPLENGVFTLPTVRVRMLDSAYQFDLTADGQALVLDIDPATVAVLKNSTGATLERTTDYGSAVWQGLTFAALVSPPFTFTVTVSDAAGIRSSLTSATITVAAPTTPTLSNCALTTTGCALQLVFDDEFTTQSSYVYAEGQNVIATVGAPLPTIRLKLADAFGDVGARGLGGMTPPQVFAYTNDSSNELLLDTAGQANFGQYINGSYFFTCIRFSSVPSALVRLSFMAVDPATSNPLLGLTSPRTGFVTVQSTPVSGFSIRYSTAGLLNMDAQPTSAIVGVALPKIVFEVIDSTHALDETASALVVTASSATGTLDPVGTTVTASNGILTFDKLRFTAAVESPTISFLVTSSSNPVTGVTLTTGTITLSTLPIPAYSIGFSPTLDSANDVVAWAAIALGSGGGTVRASVLLFDSAHEREYTVPTGKAAVVVRASSTELDIDSSSVSTVAFDAACGCGNFTSTIRGYRPSFSGNGYIRYTVVSGPALLLGQTIVAGPITLGAVSTCGSNLQETAVIAEVTTSATTFAATTEQTRESIASLLGVEADRINVTDISTISRQNHTTLESWVGSKARIVFNDPLSSSTNRKSRSDLASDFMAIRPTCDAIDLGVAAVYDVGLDKPCEPDVFRGAVNVGTDCQHTGSMPLCQCYLTYTADAAQACVAEPSVQADLVSLCLIVQDCTEAQFDTLCSSVLVTSSSNLVWIWASVGSVCGALVILIVVWKTGVLRSREKPKLGT